jgi:hypothetical protein
MADTQEYSLRPLLQQGSGADDTPIVEGSFRIHMKREDMVKNNVSNGDLILLRCAASGASGVGIAWLSNDPSKNHGSTPFLKISYAQKERCKFEYQNKCTIKKYQGTLRRAATVTVKDVTSGTTIDTAEITEDLEYWIRNSLGRKPSPAVNMSLLSVLTCHSSTGKAAHS